MIDQQGEGEMATEWATSGAAPSIPLNGSCPGLAGLYPVASRISQTPGIFRGPVCCCQIQAPPDYYFPNTLNLYVLSEISNFKGIFFNWKCITCCT